MTHAVVLILTRRTLQSDWARQELRAVVDAIPSKIHFWINARSPADERSVVRSGTDPIRPISPTWPMGGRVSPRANDTSSSRIQSARWQRPSPTASSKTLPPTFHWRLAQRDRRASIRTVLDNVAQRAVTWSVTADRVKSRFEKVRWLVFGLSIAGALAAALASQIPEDTSGSSKGHLYIAILGATLLTVATFFSKRLLGDSET